jgi:hypothetical protein
MKTSIALEETAKLVLSYILSLYLGFEWWLFLVLLLTPDLSMVGYLINNKAGAIIYNIFHHQGIGVLVGLIGLWLQNEEWMLAGLVLFGHSGMDRALGYGLKYPDNFKHTHLGWIGKGKVEELI